MAASSSVVTSIMEAWWDDSTTLVLQWVAINSLEETGEAREVLG